MKKKNLPQFIIVDRRYLFWGLLINTHYRLVQTSSDDALLHSIFGIKMTDIVIYHMKEKNLPQFINVDLRHLFWDLLINTH